MTTRGRSGFGGITMGGIIVIIGIIVLIVWACQKSDTGPNAYGPEPTGVAT